jgi:hypothetical protein
MIERLFLGVGAMKAGTTWLHRQLAGHADIHFCPEKETHYFADPRGQSWLSLENRLARFKRVVGNLPAGRINPHVRRNLAWYAEHWLTPQVCDAWYEGLFDGRLPHKAKAHYLADFSNLYATLDAQGWSHVCKIAQDVRAVYTLRHPSERLWSQFKFSYEFAGRSAEFEEVGPAEIDAFFADPLTQSIADYASSIERLRNYLPDGHVKVCFFEDFRSSPLEALRDLEVFLGLASHPYRDEALERRINPSQIRTPPPRFIAQSEAIRRDQIVRLSGLGFDLPVAWHQPLTLPHEAT